MIDHSAKKDAERYRKLLNMQTGRAAKFIEAHGTIGLDAALDRLHAKDYLNVKHLRKWQVQCEPKA